jgi:hypothetical protein
MRTKKLLSSVAATALIATGLTAVSATQAQAVPSFGDAYCKKGYKLALTYPLKAADGFTTMYYVAVFRNADHTRVGINTYGHPNHTVYSKFYKNGKTLKSSRNIGRSDCITYPLSKIKKNKKGERVIGAYGSDSSEGQKTAWRKFAIKSKGA